MSSKKIPVSGGQSPLQSPFAALDAAAFPDRPGDAEEPAPAQTPKRHRVALRREKAQRGGKTVVVIGQFPTHLTPQDLDRLLKQAKRALGCGGTLVGREMEIQGDQPERVRAFLEGEGFSTVGP